jgi:hypothetical protein
MSRPQVLSRLAVVVFVLVLLLQGAVLAFSAVHGWEGDGYMPAVAVIWGTVGLVLATRRPTNWIGWIFLLAVLFWAVSGVSGHYAKYTFLTAPGSLPGGTFAYWLMTWTWLPGFVLLPTFGLLLFPDGRLPSRRWQSVSLVSRPSRAACRTEPPMSSSSANSTRCAMVLLASGPTSWGIVAALIALLVIVTVYLARRRRARMPPVTPE